MPQYRVYYEHKMHDNGPLSPAIIHAKSEDEAAKIFDRDNPMCYATDVEIDDDDDEEE